MFSSEIQSSLGEVVRRRRVALGLSQEEFAAKVDLHRTYIGGFERGERNLSLANLSAVAAGLDVPLSSLLLEAEVAVSGDGVAESQRLIGLYSALPANRRDLLVEMAIALGMDVQSQVMTGSDLCSELFVGDFQNRLVIYHAMNDEPLKKKSFEYAFVRSMNTAGRVADLESNPVSPGTDATVDGVSYSLKTEASKSISRAHITISKLMEARWIRECSSAEEFAQGIRTRVVPHLKRYERILILRAFSVGGASPCYEYHLVEIPVNLLLKIEGLCPADFRGRTNNGSTSADVYDDDGTRLFSLRLDGSVEKITISNLIASRCCAHGMWRVHSLGSERRDNQIS